MQAVPGVATDQAVAVITGANRGLGKEVAAGVAARGFTTVLACRDKQCGAAAAAQVRELSGNHDVEVVRLDLSDLGSVRSCADEISQRWPRLDVLVNNAGAITNKRATSKQGFEFTLASNYLGPFYLTSLLLPRLLESAPCRVINIASSAHRQARGMSWEDLQAERRYNAIGAYAQSKLALLLFTLELDRRFRSAHLGTVAVHPGPVKTSFGLRGNRLGMAQALIGAIRPFMISPQRAARAIVPLVCDPFPSGSSGGYWSRRGPREPSSYARDAAEARRLWIVTTRLLHQASFGIDTGTSEPGQES